MSALRKIVYVPDAASWGRVEAAAEAAGESTSAYVLAAALARAEGELGDEMTPERWDALSAQVRRGLER